MVGSASSASAAGSLVADRARTSPTAAEPRVKGSDSASISSRGARWARPSDRLMTAKMHRSLVTVMTRTANSAASQSHSPTGPESTAKTMVASEPPSAEMATLNASLSPRCRRWTTRVTAKPSTWAMTRSRGVARSRPAPRTRSPMENVCASRCHWTWTTSASLIVKAAAQSTHGRVRAVGAPGSVRTTMTNSATAIAAREAVSSMIRWATPRRDTRDSFTSTPFVIVVTSLRPAHAGPGHPGPAHAGPGHPGPRHAGPRHPGPAHAGPGHPAPAHAGPGHPAPAHAGPRHPGPRHPGPAHAGPRHPGPAHAGPRHPAPAHAVPVRAGLDAGGEGAGVEGPTADVHLTGDLTAVDGHVHRTRRALQGAATGRDLERLHLVGGVGVLGLGQVDHAAALLGRGGARDGRSRAREQRLDLVRGCVGTLLDQQRRGARDDGGGLRGAAAAEEPLPDAGSRVRRVQVGPGRTQADHVVAGSDDVGVAG